MFRKLRMIPNSCQMILMILVMMWLTIQDANSRDTTQYKRFKRWSTTLLAKPASEQHECNDDGDCKNLPSTSCALDKIDKKKKCLCADYSPPMTNGECKRLPKALRTPCQGDVECLQGAECIINESFDSRSKLCYCREDYLEVNNTCSSGSGFPVAGPMAIAFSATFTFWTFL